MKKSLLIAAVAGLMVVSCKKEYTCECTTTGSVTQNGQTVTSSPVTSSGKTKKESKSDAKTECEKNNGTTTTGNSTNGTSSTISCSIKD